MASRVSESIPTSIGVPGDLPPVSVLLPVLNERRYLRDCLASLVGPGLPGHPRDPGARRRIQRRKRGDRGVLRRSTGPSRRQPPHHGGSRHERRDRGCERADRLPGRRPHAVRAGLRSPVRHDIARDRGRERRRPDACGGYDELWTGRGGGDFVAFGASGPGCSTTRTAGSRRTPYTSAAGGARRSRISEDTTRLCCSGRPRTRN